MSDHKHTEVRFVRIKLPIYNKVKKLAQADDRSISYMVNKLLEKELGKE